MFNRGKNQSKQIQIMIMKSHQQCSSELHLYKHCQKLSMDGGVSRGAAPPASAEAMVPETPGEGSQCLELSTQQEPSPSELLQLMSHRGGGDRSLNSAGHKTKENQPRMWQRAFRGG